MRLTQRLLLQSTVVATLLVITILGVVEWRVRHRLDLASQAQATATQPVDEDAANAALLSAIRHDVAIASGFALVIALLLARVLARNVTRPMEELRDMARDLAGGDLTARPSRSISGGEVGQLADSLRQVAEQMETRLWEMQSEEALLVALTESLNEGIVAVDARKRVVRVNQTGRQLLDLTQPVPFAATELPQESQLQEALQLVLSGAPPIIREIHLRGRTVALTVRALSGGGAVLAMYDLTQVRRLETVRSDFVANVSHELRTPLTIIGGFVETLQDDDVPLDLRRQFLGMAEANVQRMQRIVDDLLDLSRIESGGWRPAPVELDVPEVAADVFGPLELRARDKGVKLLVEFAPDASRVLCDPTAAGQILSNLAENALRHTTTGSVTIFTGREGAGVWIGVRDTGSGIPAEHLPRIFERFYRADPGRSREAGGTGLGLSIVRHLAEAHNGKVKAESTVGVGTTIAVWLPTPTAINS
ncbi:sensor histidine kinase [Gemmatimonas sp.]|uniref:sensor histidine kinase n=1 Tax=Gemmatimonas sp. TaxID=1962908 RepID=UPI003DA1D763